MPKKAIYLATPDSPDYRFLWKGIKKAEQEGFNLGELDEAALRRKIPSTRVLEALGSKPMQLNEIKSAFKGIVNKKVKDWVDENVRNGELFYLYFVPSDLNEWRKAFRKFLEKIGKKPSPEQLRRQRSSFEGEKMRNNFSPGKKHRYYCLEDDLSSIQTEYPNLLQGTRRYVRNLKVWVTF